MKILAFQKGNNEGVSQAKGEYICVLNPDTVVANDSFTKILDLVKTKQDLGIVGCKLIDGAGNFLPESKGNSNSLGFIYKNFRIV